MSEVLRYKMKMSIHHDHTLAALPSLDDQTQLYEFNCHEFALSGLFNRLNFYSDPERYNADYMLQSRNPGSNKLFFKLYELSLGNYVYPSAALLYDVELEGDLFKAYLFINEKYVATYVPSNKKSVINAFTLEVPLETALLNTNEIKIKFLMSTNSEDTDTIRLYYTCGYLKNKNSSPTSFRMFSPSVQHPVVDGRIVL
jgi:hypothetical protein